MTYFRNEEAAQRLRFAPGSEVDIWADIWGEAASPLEIVGEGETEEPARAKTEVHRAKMCALGNQVFVLVPARVSFSVFFNLPVDMLFPEK